MALRRRYLRPESFAESRPDRTLLLLDDEENVLRSLVRLFRRDGYRILAAGNVRDAFDLLATNDVQVILSDQRMSDMSGTEFLGRVKMLYPRYGAPGALRLHGPGHGHRSHQPWRDLPLPDQTLERRRTARAYSSGLPHA